MENYSCQHHQFDGWARREVLFSPSSEVVRPDLSRFRGRGQKAIAFFNPVVGVELPNAAFRNSSAVIQVHHLRDLPIINGDVAQELVCDGKKRAWNISMETPQALDVPE